MNIQTTKLELIKMIADIQSEKLLRKLAQFLKQAEKQEKLISNAESTPEEFEPEWLTLAKQPAPASIDLDELTREQNYDGKKFLEYFKNLDRSIWEGEDLKEILDSLTK